MIGVWRGNLVLRDRQTHTLWQQATGEAIDGPLAGRQLPLLGGEQTTWQAWRERYPQTTVAVEPEQAPTGLLSAATVERMIGAVTPRFAAPRFHPDPRLSPHTEVAGLVLRGEARAYPLPLLQARPSLTDTVGGIPITVQYDATSDHVSAHRRDNGEPLPIQRQWWMGWSEFHPTTSIFS